MLCHVVIYHGARGGRTTEAAAFTSFQRSPLPGGGISVAIGTAIIRGRRNRRRREYSLRLNVSTDKRGPDLLSFHESWLILAIGEGGGRPWDSRSQERRSGSRERERWVAFRIRSYESIDKFLNIWYIYIYQIHGRLCFVGNDKLSMYVMIRKNARSLSNYIWEIFI